MYIIAIIYMERLVMKKTILALNFILLFGASALAKESCFIAKDNNKVLRQEGTCTTRYAPQSTFKIALSLMGYDSGIFKDATTPAWAFKEGYDHYINVCKVAHNPKTWLRDSCLWYSRVLTAELGVEKFKEYVVKFNYGNQDVSGNKGKNDGLTHSWISSSLKISPIEQTDFILKLVARDLPITKKARDLTKEIMFLQELPGGWKLYGKTGTGDLQGWFVGWIEKEKRAIAFASHITDDTKQEVFASMRARNEALIKLWYLIDELEK